MKSRSKDHLTRALTLLEQTARRTPAAKIQSSREARAVDLAELFLAELRVRRAHLKEWIEMLNEAANEEMPARVRGVRARLSGSSGCRGRLARPAA
jgi:uncharacterized protein YigA (DUF484 family)